MDYLKTYGQIEINFAKIIGTFKEKNENKNKQIKIKYQTLEEYNEFMEFVDDDFWYAFFNFLFWHGPKKGEERALKIKNIDFDRKTVYFHETFTRSKTGGEKIVAIKNSKERTITLADQSILYLKQLVNKYKEMDGYTDDWFLFGGPFNTYKNRIDDKLKYYYNILQKNIQTKKLIL